MKKMIYRKHRKVKGICVVKLKDGQIVKCQSIKDVPAAVRNRGAQWPGDVVYAN